MSLFALALLLPGCLLQTEPCGIDFVSVDDRCVPAVDPPPYREGDAGGAFDLAPRPDAGPFDGDVPLDVGPIDGPLMDQAVPDRGPLPPVGPFSQVLLVDRTPLAVARNTPESPGADFDALMMIGFDGSFAYAGLVTAAQVNDPFGRSRFTDPNGVLGPPDTPEFENPEGVVSLGGEGGFVLLSFPFGRDFASGDELQIVELAGDAAVDEYDVYLCPAPPTNAAACLLLGRASTASRFFVP